MLLFFTVFSDVSGQVLVNIDDVFSSKSNENIITNVSFYPDQTFITQVSWRTQMIEKMIYPTIKSPSKYSWLLPGLPQYRMDEKVKAGILFGSFISTGIGSLVSFILANKAYENSQVKWKESRQIIDYEKRAIVVEESYAYYDDYNATLMLASCLAVTSISLWAYSVFDCFSTVKYLKQKGFQFVYSEGNLGLRLRL